MWSSYESILKRRDIERQIREEIKNPNFLKSYTRKTLREVMIVLFPHVTTTNIANRAFAGMTKARMYRHLQGYAILKKWQ